MRADPWRADVFQDWDVNAGAIKAQLVCAAFRQAHRWCGAPRRGWRRYAIASYTVTVCWVLGVELPAETHVGPRLRLPHPQGIIVNKDTRIGAECMIRANTTFGNIVHHDGSESGCPTIGDRVEFGVGAIVLGGVSIGDGARVGAGAVVLRDVPDGATAVGNPARIVGES